jgi:biotin-dependent carboxylase-like uncharacterized protein
VIEIIEPGPFATVQDRGRHGYASLGVTRSGAFDAAAHALANRLVGNSPDAATLEITFGGLTFRTHAAATIAMTGAHCPGLDGGAAITIASGTLIRLGAPAHGLRSYLAVRGGVAVEPELGSRSTDTIGHLGPPPLKAGDRLQIGSDHRSEVSGVTAPPARWLGRPPRLRIVFGPRADWFSARALSVLTSTAWIVRSESNRIGLRLDGPTLERVRNEELVSEPSRPGALQVPPDGRPIVLGPDAPVTGGYPVICVVRRADLDIAAQLRPGDAVTFRP